MGTIQKKRSGGTKKYGRCLRKNSKQMYKARNQRRVNKEKRILQSNGQAAVRAWRKAQVAGLHRAIFFPRVKRNLPARHN
jgi:hypothetical protein